MKTIYHPADSRGFADHGWLKAKHSFSFANYHNPDRMHFGKLRVLNDDIVAPGKGFGTHPHNNMEIITIPLRGQLEHKDSMGNGSVITPGEVQVMSAGSGIMHSEFNPSNSEEVNLFQIWIFPDTQDVDPRYDQRKFDPGEGAHGGAGWIQPGETPVSRHQEGRLVPAVDIVHFSGLSLDDGEKDRCEHAGTLMRHGDVIIRLLDRIRQQLLGSLPD